MGCYPIKKLISKALEKCNGNEKSHGHSCNHSKLIYTPPTYTNKTVKKSVNFSNHNPVYVIPSNPEPEPTLTNQYPQQNSVNGASREHGTQLKKERRRTRFALEPDHHASHDHLPQHEPNLGQPGSNLRQLGPGHNGPVQIYAPSPLPRLEEGGRRQEFFGGEYRYYPTPIRDGIYDIATDPHQLTTMFNEENPNACSIC